jgi:hypothetical protein
MIEKPLPDFLLKPRIAGRYSEADEIEAALRNGKRRPRASTH